MKTFYTFLLLLLMLNCSAQWSNTTNQFYDSLHMPVCTAVGDQTSSVVINSYPDGGYFIVWEDKREGFYNPVKVFAQKYDKDGNRLWAPNGVAIGVSANQQRFAYTGTTADYRGFSYGASDGNGGLYFTYTDDSTANYSWLRIMMQHFRPDGSVVFSGAGYFVAATVAGQSYFLSAPQLISDDNNGFYISYLRNTTDNLLYVYNYKDIAGTMVLNGGGLVNENYAQSKDLVGCGAFEKYSLFHPNTNIIAYHIWPDLLGGCSVLMSMNGNVAGQQKMLCYNRVFRVKKNAAVYLQNQFPDFNPDPTTVNYQAGAVDILYKFKRNFLTRNCTANNIVYVWTDDILLTNGYRVIDDGGYDYNFPKGTTIKTTGNISVELLTYEKRTISGNNVSPFVVVAAAQAVEKYDSVPYQVIGNVVNGYNVILPGYPSQLDALDSFRDTLIATGTYYFDYSLTSGNNQVYAAALLPEPLQTDRSVKLQHLAVELQSPKKWGVVYKTNSNKGVLIGKEISTGFTGSSISYEYAGVAANNTGNAVFYTREYGSYNRVSPILNGAEMAWGAMGRPIGTPSFAGGFVYPNQPYVSLDPTNGTGLISWQDGRQAPPNTGTNIFMRHLDNLNVANYYPPNKALRALANFTSFANPIALLGSSKHYSIIEAYNGTTGITSPVAEILDNYNLGALSLNIYEHPGPVRNYNSKPYLSRNYTIKPENNPAGAATITLRLFFTTAQFDALKTADPLISGPGSLIVIKQPNSGTAVPATYTPIAGEEVLVPKAWAAVAGGYYLEINVTGFSNFFIQSNSAALPVKWLGVQAQWQNNTQVKINWQVAEQQNVKQYTVQQSSDGSSFSNACTVSASPVTSYNCLVPANSNSKNYYRVAEQDLDGKITYSKTVLLQNTTTPLVSIYPNPAQSKLYIEGLKAGYTTIKIVDASGRLVQQQSVLPGIQNINTKALSSGVYTLLIIGGNDMQTLRFIKN